MSKNGIGLVVIIVEGILSALGIDLGEGVIARAVEGVVYAGAVILLIVNQFERRDVFAFIFKK